MTCQDQLMDSINQLLTSAKSRNTNQGVKLYEAALEKIKAASSDDEVEIYLEKMKHALIGIEAHGFFTSEEFEVVKVIRAMRP